MRLFSKTKKVGGWMAVSLQTDGICTAYVERCPQARYTLEQAAFYPARNSSDPALLEKIAKESQADRYRWTSLLSMGEYQILSVDAPPVPPDELKTAIRWRLKDLLDYHIDDATIDVLDVPVEKKSPARVHLMYAVAARNNVIEQRQALFGDAKLPISVIDIPEMAQRNVSALLERDGEGIAMLSFQSGSGLLTITHSGELYLSRQFDVAISQISKSDLEELTACYERIVLELQRSLDHFDRQYHLVPVAKLVLAPLGDMGEGMRDYLTNNLDIPVETLNLEDILDIAQVPELKSPKAQQRFFMVIGAAMRHEAKAL
jgi:MSHA biogenesis protein MshI